MLECDACPKEATHSFNIRYSNINQVRHKVCRDCYNLAMSNLMKFLKHVKRKGKYDSRGNQGTGRQSEQRQNLGEDKLNMGL